MYVAPPFSHATSAFGVALFVTVWLHVRRRWSPGGMFALGACAALLAMIREQDVFLALGPAFDFALAVSTRNSQLPTPKASSLGWLATAGAGFAGFVVAYLPQLIAYNALNGYPGPAEHVARKMYWYSPHGLQVLFSPHHGLVFWTPLVLLSIVGLIVLPVGRLKAASTGAVPAVGGGFSRPDTRRIALSMLVMVASQVYVAGSVASWTVAGAFGQRRFVCLTPVLVVGLAALWRARPERPAYARILAGVVLICVWWNIALMAQFATNLMDRQRLEPGRNVYHAFVTLPRMAPSLAYRYLVDRNSFYRPTERSGEKQ